MRSSRFVATTPQDWGHSLQDAKAQGATMADLTGHGCEPWGLLQRPLRVVGEPAARDTLIRLQMDATPAGDLTSPAGVVVSRGWRFLHRRCVTCQTHVQVTLMTRARVATSPVAARRCAQSWRGEGCRVEHTGRQPVFPA
jgi:hypothetical protein